MRDCFTRELRLQRETKSGQGAKKRRSYIYFERLLFLLPSVEQRDTSSNLDDNEAQENESENAESEQQISPRRDVRTNHSKKSFDDSLLQILNNKNKGF